MDSTDLKRTPLFEAYAETPGARLVDFGGWHLPVQFATGILVEHKSVRESAGFFDVSHMGEILVTGEGALELLQRVCTADISKLLDYQVCYSLMCEPDGGVVDDVLVYRFNAEKFWVVVNASNRDKDASWIKDAVDGIPGQNLEAIAKVRVENISEKVAQIAVQGPKAVELVANMLKLPLTDLDTFGFGVYEYFEGDEMPVLISRTGYTGEDGVEIYLPADRGIAIWRMLEELGDECIPCGLGARDTLRFEAKMPLYGHELSDMITPLEANLSWAVALEKDDFIGRDAILEQKERGVPRSLRGVVLKDKGIARSEYPVYRCAENPTEKDLIGYVTSGSPMPTVGGNAALVLMTRGTGLGIGASVYIDVRGKLKEAELVKTPFYKRRRDV